MNGELLVEIGTEEIPSGYLNDALEDLRRLAERHLRENRIQVEGELDTHGTPRRMVLIGKGFADKQEDVVQEITGTPRRAAFDEEGNPTRAALGFAKKQGVSVEDLDIVDTPKGEYLYAKRKIPGKPTLEVLTEILPRVIGELSWPKSMRWGSGSFSFVRPIHWLLALFDGEVVHFELAGVRSGNKSRGHRFMAPQIMEIHDYQDYLGKMSESSVMVDQNERKREVEKMVVEAAGTVSGRIEEDPDLLTTVTNLVEFPSAVCGGFDRAFLDIPAPVLITAMKQHQKYFAVRDEKGELMPNFVAVNNTVTRDESMVQRGHERVLRARLSDAAFFFAEDRKRPLKDRIEDLKEVIYQADLGTSFAKVQRFTKLAEYLTEQVAPEKLEDVGLAARLCKCDLVTEMVTEFPTLQGVMGREYARLDGHPDEVCRAIHEHYLPERAGDDLPASAVGALVGVADRMDTIAGFFAIKQEPTGAADPFALRRHALAIIRIMENMQWTVSLGDFISRSLAILKEELPFDENEIYRKVRDFFRDRYKHMLLRADYGHDLIEAVISVEFDRVSQLRPRLDQLKKFSTESSEFQSIALTFKRVTNILKKQEKTLDVDPSLFEEDCEGRLWKAFLEVKDDVLRLTEEKRYFEALDLTARLREPVDDLFDNVEILTKDNPQLRDNRVALLQNLARLFLSLADFSKFAI